MLNQNVDILDFKSFVTVDMSAARGNREAEPTKLTANGGGSDYDNVEWGL